MNYWHVETCDLPEFHMPLMDLLKDLKKRGNYFGLSGWCSCHNNDIWRYNYPSTKNPQWGLSVFCGFWLCRHIWEHYTHTRDAEFLKEYFDIIEDAISFIKDWSYTDKNGKFGPVSVSVPQSQESLTPNSAERPYATVNLHAQLANFEQIEADNVQVFANTVTTQNFEMIPLSELADQWTKTEFFTTPGQNL
jgi:alpha-L-fucosidase 2